MTPMHVVKQRMRHTTIAATVDIYGQVLADGDAAAGDAFERVAADMLGE